MRLYRLRKKYVCHSERSEESLCALDLSRREILRFAQNDTKTEFFRSLFSRWRVQLPAARHARSPIVSFLGSHSDKVFAQTEVLGQNELSAFFNSLLDSCGGDRRGSSSSCRTCFRSGVLGKWLAGDVHGAYASHAGGLGGSPPSAGAPRAHLPAGPGRSRSPADDLGRRQPDYDQLSLLSSCAMAAYQTDLRVVPHRLAWESSHESQSIR